MTNEELVQAYQNGDAAALEQLVNNNIGLVKYFSNKFVSFGASFLLTFDDLEQEAWAAFIDAAGKYKTDGPNEATFSTYASVGIQGKILRSINRQIPRMKKSDIESDRVFFSSLDQPLGGTEDIKVEDTLEDEEAFMEFVRLEYQVDNERLKRDLIQLLEDVFTSAKDQQMLLVLYLRYGFGGMDIKTFSEIGSMLGFSKARAQQIEYRALQKIRNTRPGRDFMRKYQAEFLKEKRNRINSFSPVGALLQKENYYQFRDSVLRNL